MNQEITDVMSRTAEKYIDDMKKIYGNDFQSDFDEIEIREHIRHLQIHILSKIKKDDNIKDVFYNAHQEQINFQNHLTDIITFYLKDEKNKKTAEEIAAYVINEITNKQIII